MPKFDSKTFNDKVFQKYLQKVEPTRENSLINSIIVNKTVNKMARTLDEQVGGNYIVEPIKGDLTGKVQNYDGQTDFQYDSRDTFEQGKPIVGRMKGWTELDFSTDITGEDFMPMAEEVSRYFEGVHFDDLMAIIQGIFAMDDTKNNNFAKNHTYTVTELTETSLNEAITYAGGDKRNKYKIAFMNSLTSLPLETKNALEYMKYTDGQGITRNLGIAQLNGIVIVVDDLIPQDVVYIVGDKFFDVDQLPVDKADYMEYVRTDKGGREYYSHKERTLYSPKYISWIKDSAASLSATTEELANGSNWEVVNNGKTGQEKVWIDGKLIPIAQIKINSTSGASTQSGSQPIAQSNAKSNTDSTK